MSSKTNIDAFNHAAAIVFAVLYESFPVPAGLQYGDNSEFAEGPTREVYEGTVEWLEAEGYIRIQKTLKALGHQSSIYHNAILTTRGLEVLRAVPESVKEKTPLGERISKALKDGGKDLIAGLIKEALSAAVRTYAS